MKQSKRFDSEDALPAALGKPLHFDFSGQTAKNRFLKAAMTERLSTWDPKNEASRGIPTKELINLYRRWGEGGFGMILTGNIMIEYHELEAAGNPIIPSNAAFSGERFEAFKQLAAESRKEGSLVVGQISHPGRQVGKEINPHPISASNIQLEPRMGMEFAKPRPAETNDLKRVVEGFAHAAEYLYKSGYDGIQLHGAHGYLLSQFLSPTTNQRKDKYGGSLENRARLIFEINDAIRKRVPDTFFIGIKVNSVEFQDKGFNESECRQLCKDLEAARFDFVELSGGNYQHLAFNHQRESTKKREAFFLKFADTIVPALKKTKVYVTGGFRTLGGMVKALESIDGVGIARPVCQEPDFPNKVLAGKVKGAIEQLLDPSDFPTSNLANGTLLKMIGRDQNPIDLSQEDKKDLFFKSQEAWQEKMSKDKERRMYGYAELEDFKPAPYGRFARA